ncbi:diguanylate cyclase [Novosphingobium sediminicola]|uniref:diguanylate cyclase n=1 Tax=Novosphingobium sediminicola TaxID=563162 RepID=A0A7W6CQF0_9SPHN|nr:diguanylate cyclase [Novosphingobium sediminicola]MBB3957276.1 diguanylate cyclase (GGDEF)-like protein [Novosphingobium sediminicola]
MRDGAFGGGELVMGRPLVLIVDDEVSNIEIMNAALEDDYEICFATSGEEAITVAQASLPDLILLDVLMPGTDGYEVCRRCKADPLIADVPIIFTTGLGDEESEANGLLLGAIDYIVKPIHPAIVRARVHNHIELKRMRDQLAELAVTDALTGLSNRRRLEQTLDVETSRLSRTDDWLSVIMLDIDFFKQFNDAYGHPEGDNCIVMIAAALQRAVRRASDLTARYGGEEFACVLPATDHEAAVIVANSIMEQVRSLGIPHRNSEVGPYVTVSVGIASARCRPGLARDLWVKVADNQLYLAKVAGRNKVVGTVFGIENSEESQYMTLRDHGVAPARL